MKPKFAALPEKTRGVLALLMACIIWGVQSVYWKAMPHMSAGVIMCNRIVWAGVILFAVALATGRLKGIVVVLRNRRQLLLLTVSAVMICSNWYLNIYGPMTGQVVVMSLGHYINPLAVILIGIFFFHETVSRRQLVSLGLVALALILMTIDVGYPPLLALAVTFTFIAYTVVRKVANADPFSSLCVEIAVMWPLALVFTVLTAPQAAAVIQMDGMGQLWLLVGTGLYTCVPLFFYSYAVATLSLTTLGFFKYFSPTIELLLGVFVFREMFSSLRLVSFAVIWIAIANNVMDDYRTRKQRQAALNEELQEGAAL